MKRIILSIVIAIVLIALGVGLCLPLKSSALTTETKFYLGDTIRGPGYKSVTKLIDEDTKTVCFLYSGVGISCVKY